MSTQEVSIREMNSPPEKESQETEGKWLSLQKASNVTGLSMATLRRYVKKKKLESRRLGRTSNSKVQVYITSDMVEDRKEERVSTDGFEEVLDPLNAELVDQEEDDDDDDEGHELVDQTSLAVETPNWLKQRVEEKDDHIQELLQETESKIQEKDKKIEQLQMQLQAASHRNGYLEAQNEVNQEKIKLLTQIPEEEFPESEEEQEVEKGFWMRFRSWFVSPAKEESE